jgi:hypothetical protein
VSWPGVSLASTLSREGIVGFFLCVCQGQARRGREGGGCEFSQVKILLWSVWRGGEAPSVVGKALARLGRKGGSGEGACKCLATSHALCMRAECGGVLSSCSSSLACELANKEWR